MTKEKSVFGKFRDWLATRIHLKIYEDLGIEFDWAFAPDYSPYAWRDMLHEADPNTLGFISRVVEEALNKTVDERNTTIENISSAGISLTIGPHAEQHFTNKKQMDQLALNIFSLSEENLANLQAALNNLPEG